MLIKRTQPPARRGTFGAMPERLHSGRAIDRRGFLRRSGLVAGSLAAARHAAARQSAACGSRCTAAGRRGCQPPQEHLYPLLGRLLGHRRSRKRRLDRPGAGLRQPDQSRVALLQGRGGSRRCAERAPVALSGEARRRSMDPDFLGSGDRRDRRQDHGDPRQVRTRTRSTGLAPPNSPTRPPISIASSPRSGEPIIPIIRRASVIPPPSPA